MIQEAEAIGSVTEVCLRAGITRPTFYQWKRRYLASGLLGLEDRPKRPSKGRPPRATAGVKLTILEHARQAPELGCLSLAKRLDALGIKISSPTVQKLLNQCGLGSQEARAEWVRRGAPLVEMLAVVPNPETLWLASYETARSLYFFGIPESADGRREILTPTLEEVAHAIEAPLATLQLIAVREHWDECRERQRAQYRLFEAEAGMGQSLSRLDSAVVTGAVLGLKHLGRSDETLNGMVTPLGVVKTSKALKQLYRLFRLPFGRRLPVLFDPTGVRAQVELADYPLGGSGERRSSRVLSESSIDLAKRTFFMGISGGEHGPLNPKPSIRDVAEHLALPAGPLQRLALQQQWVGTRRTSDRWGGSFRVQRVVHQVGREALVNLVWKFFEGVLAVLQRVNHLCGQNSNISPRDALRVAAASEICLELCLEIQRDFSFMTGHIQEAQPKARKRKPVAPKEVEVERPGPNDAFWHDLSAKWIAIGAM